MNVQNLTDRLVVAIEEQDVLYVLHWLKEMRELNCLEQAINNRHSWKGYSALESLIKSPFTQLRRLILEILLSQGADSRVEAGNRKNGSEEALQVLMNWETSGKQAAKDARHLLSISLEQAAEWIDQNLPPPPNASSLTGCNDPPQYSASSPSPLPALNDISTNNPETDSKPSSNSPKLLPQSNSQTPRTRSPSPNYRFSRFDSASLQATGLPSSPSIDPRSRFSERFQSIIPTTFPVPQYSPPRHLSRSSSLFPTPPVSRETSISASSTASHSSTPATAMTRLNLSYLPIGFEPVDLKSLFTDLRVVCQIILCHTSYSPTYAFVDVRPDQVLVTVGALDGKLVQGSRIGCKRLNPHSQRPPQSEPRFAPTSKGSVRSSSTSFASSWRPGTFKPVPIARQPQQNHHLRPQDSNVVSQIKSSFKRKKNLESTDLKEDWDAEGEGEGRGRKRSRR